MANNKTNQPISAGVSVGIGKAAVGPRVQFTSSSPAIIKKGDWRMWADKYYEKEKEVDALKRTIDRMKHQPDHIWRSIWRYWFGSVTDERIYVGKLLTAYRRPSFGMKWIICFFSGKFSIRRMKFDSGTSYIEFSGKRCTRTIYFGFTNKNDSRKKWKIYKELNPDGDGACCAG